MSRITNFHRAILLGILLVVVMTTIQITEAGLSGSNSLYLPMMFSFQPPPEIQAVPFAEGFTTDAITDIASAGDDRLFVVLRQGVIRIVQPDGTILPTPFLAIQNQIVHNNWEQGMLGLAFHPNYPQTPYFYVSFTSVNANKVYISRFNVSAGDANVADPASQLDLLRINKTLPESLVHNGGDLNFGPDGYLYISIGDGGPDPKFGSTTVHDPANNGYRTDTLLGKILRIDVNGTGLPPQDSCSGTSHYTIPPDNPFADGDGPQCDEIWAKGLRNPWRVSFDRLTGDLFIADVGEWEREEIDWQSADSAGGEDYGWRCWEGTYDQTIPHPIIADRCPLTEEVTFPIYEYNQSQHDCSIIGGFVYRGSLYPSLRGHYIFGDFCNGALKIISKQPRGEWVRTFNLGTGFHISTFGEDANGELYLGEWGFDGTATLYRLEAVTSPTK